MKSKIIVVLIIISLLSGFTACGKQNNNQKDVVDNTDGKETIDETTEIETEPITEFSVGDIVTFGYCEQDNQIDNGSESIEWIVYDIKDGKALMMTKLILFNKSYGDYENEDCESWEDSSIRKWLNTEFYNSSFTEKEKKGIVPTKVSNEDLEETESEDKIFLFSYAEAKEYLANSEYAVTSPTSYLLENDDFDIYDLNEYGHMEWWTRTPKVFIDDYGYVHDRSAVINKHGIRPALWVDLTTLYLSMNGIYK